MEVSNAPKKHKYHSHFRKIKALRLTDFQQNKDVLCTLESDDSCMQDNSYFSMNNSSLMGDHSFLKRKTNTCSKTIENLEDITLQNNNQVNTLDPSFLKRKGSLPAQLKQIGNPSAIPGSILTNRANLPPYRVPKQLQTNQTYLNPYNQQSNKRHSRDNSAYSVHTRRSSVSNVEKTNVSGWSFMLAAPALSIHKLISKGQKKGNNQKQKENKTFVNDIDSFVDLAPFKVEPKFLKSINNIAIQIFNNDSLRGLSFMVLFKLLRQNPKDIALFLYKAESADTFKKSQYQITQLLTNTHLKETLDILYQYSNFYQFDGLSFVEALRFYLSNFILENDPDKIDWILKGFTKRYYATIKKQEQSKIQKGGETKRKEHFETPEAVQMLAFATVMLDIELHQAIERDISFDNSEREGTIKGEFVVSLAYVNGGENFSKGFIDDIFENVKRKKVIRLLDQSNNEQAERSLRFKLESAKLMVKARKVSKKDKKIIKDYLLCFDGPVCCVVKMIGEISELKAVFVTKGCKIVRAKDNKIKFRKINAEDKEEIHYGKFRTAGDIVVSSKSELIYNIETGNDVMRIQKFLESINM